MKWLLSFLVFSVITTNIFAQEPFIQFKVIDSITNNPLENVTATLHGTIVGKTNKDGLFGIMQNKLQNSYITFSAVGYKSINSYNNDWHNITIVKMQADTKIEENVTIVSSTRNNQKIENSPLKVEVLGREEMDEENTIKPANIASILGDVSGVQIQQTSATTGNANVRIQGLSGQYTQILKDGMPLYEGFSGGFGVLSIPPLDLKQVELIKGSASTLYGGGAIGGLVNIISRTPKTKQDAVITLNASTLKEKNANFYIAKKYKKIGYTLFGGYTNQSAIDVNKDGFSDVAKTNAFIIHPRLFFYPNANTTIAIGENYVYEDRIGGNMNYINKQLLSGVSYFFEKNIISRSTSDIVLNSYLKNNYKLEFKSSFSSLYRDVKESNGIFGGVQNNFFSELSLQKTMGKNNIVGGLNYLADKFRQLTSSTNNIGLVANSTVGIFLQNTLKLNDNTIVEAGIRNDLTQHYGNFVLPRIALIHHLNEAWGIRAGVGFGYKVPNALNNQIKDVPLYTILPIAAIIKAEKSIGYNAEINYKYVWGKNELFINHAFFLTNITRPIISNLTPFNETYFTNANKNINTKGFDTYIKLQLDALELYSGFTYTIANRNYLTTNKFMTYIPKIRAAFTVVKNFEENGFRIGLEGSYNGKQFKEDGSKTPSYLFLAGLVDKKLGKHFTIVLNCENILDYRQSKQESLYTGSISNPQFKTLWAPIDGRVVNLAVKYSL